MSQASLLATRGRSTELGAYVVTACFNRGDTDLAFGLADGTLRLARPGGAEWREVAAHDGALLCLVADPGGDGWISGGDDGKLLRIARDGSVTPLAGFGSRWVEHVAGFADGKSGRIAAAVGKHVHLLDLAGEKLKSWEHPSSVSGVVFDAKGKRVAASHYNGASLWFVAAKTDSPRLLTWKGSHTGIAMSPDGTVVVTTMQENSLHGWRLTDGQHMRMSGYPSKTRSLCFTRNGKWLATSGAEVVVLWPFTGGGPTGKAPLELGGGVAGLCTVLHCHPQGEIVAAGFGDGMVMLIDVTGKRVLPVGGEGNGPVSAVTWNNTGTLLAYGTETGFAALVDLGKPG